MLEPSLLGCDEGKGRPIQSGTTARDPGNEPVMHDADRRHGHARGFGLGKRQAYVFEGEGEGEARRVAPLHHLRAVDLVHPAAEHRARHDVEELLGLDAAFAQKSNDFGERLQVVAIMALPDSFTKFPLAWSLPMTKVR